MNVYVLTFNKERNNGAFLQCFALCEVLKSLGHNVRLLEVKLLHERRSLARWCKDVVSNFFWMRIRHKYLPVTANPSSISEDDICIVGSDQVWNPEIVKQNLDKYFFSFLPDNVVRLSYAASFGTPDWEASVDPSVFAPLLKKFKNVSVREKSGITICKECFDRADAIENIDPALLYAKFGTCFNNEHCDTINELIVYEGIKDSSFWNFCRKVAEKRNLHIRSLGFHDFYGVKPRPFYSPVGWMKVIQQSSFVISGSFHAIVFAIQFHKPFVAIAHDNRKIERLRNLLTKLDLQNHILFYDEIDHVTDISTFSSIDYEKVDQIIKVERERSITYLKENIGGK